MTHTVTYKCLMCHKDVTEQCAAIQKPIKVGICAPCAIASMREAFDDAGNRSWWNALFNPTQARLYRVCQRRRRLKDAA